MQNDDTKDRLWGEITELNRSQFERIWTAAFKAGLIRGREQVLEGVREYVERDAKDEQPPPAPQTTFRVLPKPQQKSLALNRAGSGQVQELIEALLKADETPQGLIPSRAVALAKAQGKALKESSARMAFFGLQKKGVAIQSPTTKAWFHVDRKSAALAARSGGPAESEPAARNAFN